MLVGHHGVGFQAKRFAPGVSLGTLQFACVLADVLTFVLQMADVEHARVAPGITAFSYIDGYDTALSHSLVTTVIWSAVAAGLFLGTRRDRIEAFVLRTLVFSHWILDVVSHRPEIALAPGIHVYLGLGLWNSIPGTFVVEGILWLLGLSHLRPSDSSHIKIRHLGHVGLYPCLDIVLDIDAVSAATAWGVFRQPTWHHLAALCSVDRAKAHWTDQNRTSRHELLSTQVVATGGSHE